MWVPLRAEKKELYRLRGGRGVSSAGQEGSGPKTLRALDPRPRPLARAHTQRLVHSYSLAYLLARSLTLGRYEDDEWMTIDPENYLWNRPELGELGVLERRVRPPLCPRMSTGMPTHAKATWTTQPPLSRPLPSLPAAAPAC